MLEDVTDWGRFDHEEQQSVGNFPNLTNMVFGHLSQGTHVLPTEHIFQVIVMSIAVPAIE
jgi:hypothetical protein